MDPKNRRPESANNTNARGTSQNVDTEAIIFAKEYWTGDSRDGAIVNGDGYHYYRMSGEGLIIEAYEFYETDDGLEVALPLPEMLNINWHDDLGFEDMDALDIVKESEFDRIKDLTRSSKRS
jgi:hypothetical protein